MPRKRTQKKTKLTTAHRYIPHHLKVGWWKIIDHFLPHERNNYRPHAMRHHVLAGYSVILILLKVIVILGPVALPSSTLYSSAITVKNIVELTNQSRANLGLPTLAVNERLAEAARRKAEDMLAAGYFAHTSPAGRTPWDWIREAGYRYRHAGENLAVHFHTAEDVQSGWMASPTHRANIVNPRYSEIGIGTATGTFEGVTATFVVQMFGLPTTVAAATGGDPTQGATSGSTLAADTTTSTLVDRSSVTVAPAPGKLSVSLSAPAAEAVRAEIAGTDTDLRQAEGGGRWRGELSYNDSSLATSGEPLFVTAARAGVLPETQAVALIAPLAKTQQLYIFNEGNDRFVSLFGGFLHVDNLDDKIRFFYLAFSVFLAAGILAYLFVLRFRVRHQSLISHSVAVVALAVLLLVV